MRAALPDIIATLPDVVLVPDLIRLVNAANGLTPLQMPTPAKTYSWLEIYIGMKQHGFRPTFMTGYGTGYDVEGHRIKVPTIDYGFARTTPRKYNASHV